MCPFGHPSAFFSVQLQIIYSVKHLNFTRQDQQEKGSAETNENDPRTTANKEDDMFVGLDDVPGKCTF
jgi:condensin-2 complex subunit H2